MNLDYLAELYRSQSIGEIDELMHLQWLRKVKNWLSKTDEEKLERRKSYLRTTKIQFKEEDGLEYVEQSIIVIDYILEFLAQADYSDLKFEGCVTEVEKFIFRIYNMLWCEKEYILYMENPRATKVHVSMDVFQPLITKIEGTKEYANYNLIYFLKSTKKC